MYLKSPIFPMTLLVLFAQPYPTMSIINHFASLTFLLLFLYSCSSAEEKKKENSQTNDKQILIAEGESKFMAYCYSCHNDQTSADARLAPSTRAIQTRYKKAHPDESAFSDAITSFVLKPDEKNALLKKAVKKFGLMPPMAYPENDLKAIAHYMFHGKFKSGGSGNQTDSLSPMNVGSEMAAKTKSILGKNLMQSLKKGGTVYAIDFCNTKAIHYTDSMSQVYGSQIKRVSDQPRNPNNQANKEELDIISDFKAQLSAGNNLQGVLKEDGEGYRYYSAITTNAMCLQCHGKKGTDITPETTAKIAERYPNDLATGYGLNEIRGIWSIYFKIPNS
jgi:cytochrome c553